MDRGGAITSPYVSESYVNLYLILLFRTNYLSELFLLLKGNSTDLQNSMCYN